MNANWAETLARALELSYGKKKRVSPRGNRRERSILLSIAYICLQSTPYLDYLTVASTERLNGRVASPNSRRRRSQVSHRSGSFIPKSRDVRDVWWRFGSPRSQHSCCLRSVFGEQAEASEHAESAWRFGSVRVRGEIFDARMRVSARIRAFKMYYRHEAPTFCPADVRPSVLGQ